MGSRNATGVSVVPKHNASVYNIGQRQVIASGVPFSRSQSTKADTPLHARDSAALGTQPDVQVVQRSTIGLAHKQKVAQSDNDGLHGRVGARYVPTSAIEEEIANKGVSQYRAMQTGARVVIRNSDNDGLVARKNS